MPRVVAGQIAGVHVIVGDVGFGASLVAQRVVVRAGVAAREGEMQEAFAIGLIPGESR